MFSFRRIVAMLFIASVVLTACSGQKPSETKQTVNVQVSLTEFGIKSSLTQFETGVPYHFIVTNTGVAEHEFMIMPPLTQDQMGMHMDMTDLDKKALAMIEAEDLQAGKTASFDITFTEPANSGDLEFACHTPGHYELNMKLPIIVQ